MYWKILMSVLLMTASVSLSSNVFAQGPLEAAIVKAGLQMSDVKAVTTFYYQNPQPEKLISVLKVLLTVNEFTSDSNRFAIITHLISTIAHNDKTVLERLTSLENSSSEESKKALEQIVQDANNFQSPLGDTQEHLNYLWAEFFATGKDDSVKKIIDALRLPVEKKANQELVVIALWSLGSNAKQHTKVYEIIKEQALKANGTGKDQLEKILEQTNTK
ncbi:MAG: hypothetical protein WCH62_03570 [Candidatus Omnitrophota bacterium]